MEYLDIPALFLGLGFLQARIGLPRPQNGRGTPRNPVDYR